MNVQRYSLIGNDECPVMVGDATGCYVLFTDHEAALAAADAAGYEAGLRARWGEREDRAWNAALDAVLATQDGSGFYPNRVAALRKPTPQPEPVPHWPCECGSVCSEPAAAQPEEES